MQKKEEAETVADDVIVIDNGTAYIKAGFAGEDTPRLIIPTAVAELQPQGMIFR